MDHDDVPTFKLEIGESCVIKPSYLEQLKNVDKYKVMFTCLDEEKFLWLDNEGKQGIMIDVMFDTRYWELLK